MSDMHYFVMPILKYRPVPSNPNWRAEKIIDTVCEYYGVELALIKGKKRDRYIVTPRHVMMYMLRKHTKLTVMQIGKMFSRDHTTALHSEQTVNDLMFSDEGFRKQVHEVENKILS